MSKVYIQLFSALADPTRLEMIRMLASAKEVACTTFDQKFQVSKSTISYHVRTLRNAGVIDVRKEGSFFYYTLVREVFDHYLPRFLEKLQHGAQDRGRQSPGTEKVSSSRER